MTNIDSVDPTIQAILRADHLSEEPRIGYSKRLALIATAAKNKALQSVLTLHPQKVLNWILRSYTEVGTQKTTIVAVLAAFKLLNLKANKKASYAMYLEQYKTLKDWMHSCETEQKTMCQLRDKEQLFRAM